MSRVTILGANGFTGTIITKRLDEEHIPYSVAIRNKQEYRASNFVENIFQLDLLSAHPDYSFLDQTDILVNCVGPYMIYGQNLLKEIWDRSLYYLDLTGEQSFVKCSLDTTSNKSCIIHSCSFESALADLLAFEHLPKSIEYESINSFYKFNSTSTSRGTRFTMKVHNYFNQFALINSELKKITTPFVLSDVTIKNNGVAFFTPYPEVLFFSKNYKVKNSSSFILIDDASASFALEKNTEEKKIPLEKVINRFLGGQTPFLTDDVRQKQNFNLIVAAKCINGRNAHVSLSGKDMYGITAELIISAINILRNRKTPIFGQTLSPAEILHDAGVLTDITKRFKMSLSYSSKSL